MAFMLAIVFAFATEKPITENESMLITGYIYKDGKCENSTRNCSNSGQYPCTDGINQVYMHKLSETVCSQELFNWTP